MKGIPSFRKIALKGPIECSFAAAKTSSAGLFSAHRFCVRSLPISFNNDRHR